MTLDWLAGDLRAAGLDVREIDGWQTRARPGAFAPLGVLIHDTGVSTTKGDAPSLQTCIDGRTGLPGPLCQLLIARSATVWLIAGGRCNHAGVGALPPLVPADAGNSMLIGIEMENTGAGTEPWPARQIEVAQICTAVIVRRLAPPLGPVPAGFVPAWGHREYALPKGRKPDPVGVDMGAFRQAVADILNRREKPPMPSTPGTWSLADLPATLDCVDALYAAAGQAISGPDRGGWAKDITIKLAARTDPTPTLEYIWYALNQPAKA